MGTVNKRPLKPVGAGYHTYTRKPQASTPAETVSSRTAAFKKGSGTVDNFRKESTMPDNVHSTSGMKTCHGTR
jgi:hypothetical protein